MLRCSRAKNRWSLIASTLPAGILFSAEAAADDYTYVAYGAFVVGYLLVFYVLQLLISFVIAFRRTSSAGWRAGSAYMVGNVVAVALSFSIIWLAATLWNNPESVSESAWFWSAVALSPPAFWCLFYYLEKSIGRKLEPR